MVVDTSAIAAILFGEEDKDSLLRKLVVPGRKFMASPTWTEISIVVEARKGEAGTRALRELAAALELEILPFDNGQAALAFDAWQKYGKGRHEAALNMGDCASYALARFLNDRLLCKGNDFVKTDIALV